ncbi:hypothetical protein VB780_11200 [Leptolyngbya sp. CCNP1308]|uniref:hypothetical protein n=1 Tax=Leptolyngbya sp. CCNP1308 TaxID=3110255 RepID=UPI002B207F4B|nr:hypothetical protein [Leptolyngbya sp. CCNP1308]MEA5449137.1 hypothetical protein [Leptolyngbya sp. CCNP1308]
MKTVLCDRINRHNHPSEFSLSCIAPVTEWVEGGSRSLGQDETVMAEILMGRSLTFELQPIEKL